MSKNYIENPLSHPEWDPSKGDFFSSNVHREVQNHKKALKRKKLFITSLIAAHIVLLVMVLFYIS
jgi:hypothetical protein